MCGIFGLIAVENQGIAPSLLRYSVNKLFSLSESRGKEAAGVAIFYCGLVNIYKRALPAHCFIRSGEYKNFFRNIFTETVIAKPIAIIGHSRLATDGTVKNEENNQPIRYKDITVVHNGIIVNTNEIWQLFPLMERRCEVDTEVIPLLIDIFYEKNRSLMQAIREVFTVIRGTASIATIVSRCNQLVLATNTGSLYISVDEKKKNVFFASEEYILKKFFGSFRIKKFFNNENILQVKPGSGYVIGCNDFSKSNFSFNNNLM